MLDPTIRPANRFRLRRSTLPFTRSTLWLALCVAVATMLTAAALVSWTP